MNYFSLSGKIVNAGASTFDFLDAASEGNSSKGRLVIKGLLALCSVTVLAIDILKLQGIKDDEESTAKQKIEELIKTTIVINGIAICTQAYQNLLDGQSPVNLENLSHFAGIFGDVEDLYNIRPKLISNGIHTFVIYRNPIINSELTKAAEITFNTGISLYNTSTTYLVSSYVRTLSFLSPVETAPIVFDIGDTENIVPPSIAYSDLPLQYLHNPVFRKHVCPLSGRPIRYPVIILNTQNSAPFAIPVVLFEKKAIIKLLMNQNTFFILTPKLQ